MTETKQEDKFTLEDAENDGKIKREAGVEMKKVASREYGELFEMFADVCDGKGVDPKTVLGDGVLKAIRDEDFAERLSSVEIDMSAVKGGSMRIEDAKMMTEFAEELGIDQSSGEDAWLEETVKERIMSKTSSPVPDIPNRGGGAEREVSEGVRQDIENLSRQVNRLAEQVDDGQESSGNSDSKKDTDELFESVGDSSPDEPEKVVEVEEEEVDKEEDVDEDETSTEPGSSFEDMETEEDDGEVNQVDEDDIEELVSSVEGGEEDE
jgi:hypothetical protein